MRLLRISFFSTGPKHYSSMPQFERLWTAELQVAAKMKVVSDAFQDFVQARHMCLEPFCLCSAGCAACSSLLACHCSDLQIGRGCTQEPIRLGACESVR